MQTKREQKQTRMMLLPPLEEFIPEDHPLRRLNRVLDLGFVHEAVREHYCRDNGRPSIDPEVIIRLFLLQAIEGLIHVRDLMRQVHVNLAYRWFIGYDLDEKLPDHSSLSRALDRFGDEVFNELFKRSIAQCKASKLIEGRVLHWDATTIRADIDRDRVNEPDSPDPDARYGHFPGGKVLPGYKQQTIADEKSRVIVGIDVIPADRPEGKDTVAMVDQATEHLGIPPKVVCADSAYASGANKAALEDRGVCLVSPPPKPITYTKDRYYTVEDFKYNEPDDVFTCPGGQTLRNVSPVKARIGKYLYRCSKVACRSCKIKSKCTEAPYRQLKVGVHHGALIRLRAESKTESFRQFYRARAPVIEGIFAESKCWHGLRRAWRRGLAKMRIQSLLIAAAINLKRLISLFIPQNILNSAAIRLLARFWATMNKLIEITYQNQPLNLKLVQI